MQTVQSPPSPRRGRTSRKAVWGLPVALVMAASTALSPVNAQGSPRPPAVSGEDSAKVFLTTPSSEPNQITPGTVSYLKVYDPTSLTLVDNVRTPDFRPHHLYPLPGQDLAIQAHFGPTRNVEIINLKTNQYVGRIPTGEGPRHLSYNPSGTRAYTADFNGNTISVLDVRGLRNIATLPVGIKPNYVQYVKTPRGPRLFVENFGTNTVTVINASTLRTIGTVTVGDGPFNASVAEDGRTLITANARDNTVSFVDTTTLEVTDTIDIQGTHDPSVGDFQRLNPRISPEGKWLWVGNQDASTFSIINIPERRFEKLLPAGKGADISFFPAGGPAKGLALLTNRYDTFVTVAKLNGDQPPTLVKNISTSALGSHFITFNSDFSKGYVSQRPGRAFSVFDMATLTETANVPVGPGPKTDPLNTSPTQAGPDQAIYIWFEDGQAKFHDEGAC